nr:hypothetical protein CFP56_12299 [Quercus suber]
MRGSDSTARESYLEDASQLLNELAPVAAAHMRVSRHCMKRGQDNSSGSQGMDRTCFACGNSLLLGWSCTSVLGKTGIQTRKNRISKSTNDRKIECSMCNSVSTISLQRRVKSTLIPDESKSRTMPSASEQRPTPVDKPVVGVIGEETASPAAKRRVRNKKSSLQAILANQSVTNKSTSKFPGFDIMDFMKS